MYKDSSFYMKLQREEIAETFEDNEDAIAYQEEREAYYAEDQRDLVSDIY